MKFLNNKSNAMSPIGYVIALIIFIGVGMIISAPFIADNSDNNKELENINRNYERSYNNFSDLEANINRRLDNIENRLNSMTKTNSNKYTCTIEGTVDENGNIAPIENVSGNQKFVFVCEYKN
jgi:hypothetical protein